jgi:DNA-binding response OmpR family regulator
LIVEDNPTTRTALERLLAMEGFHVESAATLQRGMERLDGHAAVILDLDLPDGSGIDLLRKVRTDRLPIQVLVVSACSDAAVLDEVRALQPDAMLCKPLDVSKLFEHLDRTAERPARGRRRRVAALGSGVRE